MNKVKNRCANSSCAKFLYASNRMFLELKLIKLFLYSLNAIPVVICFLPESTVFVKTICSLVSFALTLVAEVSSQLVSNYKEKAILEKQLYEAEITGSTFSKIEYDRESTNDMQELAIRKGNPKLIADQEKGKEFPVTKVPDEISDDYSYLFIARQQAARTRFILSREFYFYMILLVLIGAGLVSSISLSSISASGENQNYSFYYVICFWPLIVPLIRNLVACQKGMKQCVKICADIDNFFADGDDSIERLARFYFYVQNIEFEMLLVKPIVFKFIEKLYTRPMKVLYKGVTVRFMDAIKELKTKKYISQPKGKDLITKVDYDLDELKEKQARLKKKQQEAIKLKEQAEKPKKSPSKGSEVVMSKSKESVEIPKKKSVVKKVVEEKPITKKVQAKKAEIKETKAAKKAAPTKGKKK